MALTSQSNRIRVRLSYPESSPEYQVLERMDDRQRREAISTAFAMVCCKVLQPDAVGTPPVADAAAPALKVRRTRSMEPTPVAPAAGVGDLQLDCDQLLAGFTSVSFATPSDS